MRLFLGVLLALLMLNCSVLVPQRTIVKDSPVDYQLVLDELDGFRWQWYLKFDQDIKENLEGIRVTFIPKTEEEWWTPGCVRGQTDPYNYSWIQVAYISDQEFRFSQTAFYHELVHLVLGQLVGNGDYNHAQPPGPWTEEHEELIRRMKELAKLREPAPL